ncbi:MAG: hypothetical protein CSA66_07630 [Proteobacteria bacterium]|nr:MAG: hypothetical protein CSA66_07630 [Pseudomonadota bacterium]
MQGKSTTHEPGTLHNGRERRRDGAGSQRARARPDVRGLDLVQQMAALSPAGDGFQAQADRLSPVGVAAARGMRGGGGPLPHAGASQRVGRQDVQRKEATPPKQATRPKQAVGAGGLDKHVKANALSPRVIMGWFVGLQAPWDVALNAHIGLDWNAKLAAVGVSLFAKGKVSQDDDGRFRTALTIGVKGSAEFNVFVFAAKVQAQVSYAWGYTFQGVKHFAARMHALVADYLKKIKKYLILDHRADAARELHVAGGAGAPADKAWRRLAATPPIEVQKAEVQLGATLKTISAGNEKRAIKAWLAKRPKVVRQFMDGPSVSLAYSGAVAYFYRRLDKARPGDDKAARWQVKKARIQSVAGTLEHDGVSLTVTVQQIDNHANPDQDGLYLNLAIAQGREANASSKWNDVFSEKNAGKVLLKLGELVPAGLATFENAGKAIDLAKKVVDALQASDTTTVARTSSSSVSYEAHLVHEGAKGNKGFRLQFVRASKSGGVSVKAKTPGPWGSKLTLGVGVDGSVTLAEVIGSNTLSYIKTAYNGFRSRGTTRQDPRFTGPWSAFRRGKIVPVLDGLCKNVKDGKNAFAEARADGMTAFVSACKARKGAGDDAAVLTALDAGLEQAWERSKRAPDPKDKEALRKRWRNLPKLTSEQSYALMKDKAKLAKLPLRQLSELLELTLARWFGTWRDHEPIINLIWAARVSNQDAALISRVGFMRLYRALSWAGLKKVCTLLGTRFVTRLPTGKRVEMVELLIKQLPARPPTWLEQWRADNVVAGMKVLGAAKAGAVIRKIGVAVFYSRLGPVGSYQGQELINFTNVRPWSKYPQCWQG